MPPGLAEPLRGDLQDADPAPACRRIDSIETQARADAKVFLGWLRAPGDHKFTTVTRTVERQTSIATPAVQRPPPATLPTR